VYRCADGRYVAVGALEPKFFASLCGALNQPDLVALQHHPNRQEEVRARLAEVFASRTRDEWAQELRDSDACVAPVLDLAEAMAASPAVSERTLGDGSTMLQVGLPFARSGQHATPETTPAPHLGQHTAELLAELGYDEDRVSSLRAAGVV
jgi:alpha-methylacyl-CoA racemase